MRPTSSMLTNAIAFVKADSQIARKLEKRDSDRNIYMRQIICRMEKYEDDPDKFFVRIFFDYALYDTVEGPQPDFYIDLKPNEDGTFKILPPPRNFVPNPNYD